MSIQRILLAALCCLALPLIACRDSARNDELASKDKIIAELNARLNEREQQIQELTARLELTQSAAGSADALQACEQQLAQLRGTLNRAFLDMKIALVERDACCRRAAKDKPETPGKRNPSETRPVP